MTAGKIQTALSDEDLYDELLTNIMQRKIDQKFFYIDEGTDLFYTSVSAAVEQKTGNKVYANKHLEYNEMIEKHIGKNTSISIVSLGCGGATIDKTIITSLQKKGYGIQYIGIDSSGEMLSIAQETLSDIEVDSIFHRTDLTKRRFFNFIKAKKTSNTVMIFLFVGFTFGNINQFSLIDSWYNMMDKGDMLLFDSQVRIKNQKNAMMSVFDRFLGHMQNDARVNWILSPFRIIGIPPENGKLKVLSDEDEYLGSFNFTFYFEFTKKTHIQFRDNITTILPGEKIQLLSHRFHDSEKLKEFMEEHEFLFIDSEQIIVNELDGQELFLFTK